MTFSSTKCGKLLKVIGTVSFRPIRRLNLLYFTNYTHMQYLTYRAFRHLSEHPTVQAFCQYINALIITLVCPRVPWTTTWRCSCSSAMCSSSPPCSRSPPSGPCLTTSPRSAPTPSRCAVSSNDRSLSLHLTLAPGR